MGVSNCSLAQGTVQNPIKKIYFFFFPIKIFIRNLYICLLEKHKIPVPYPGLVNISGMYRNCVSLFSTLIIQLR
jgi:hypothetical protein